MLLLPPPLLLLLLLRFQALEASQQRKETTNCEDSAVRWGQRNGEDL